MKSSTRYTLIAVFIVVFLILAPTLIFYVSGRPINLDNSDNDTVTGLLDAKTNPSSAKLLVDGKEHSSTPAIARFLPQGEYVFTLSKDGYYDWSKRLPIEAGKVTYAQEGVTEVQLIKKSEPRVLVPSGVSSFVLIDDTIWFAQGNNVAYAPIDNPQKINSVTVGYPPATLSVLRDKRNIYVGGNQIIDSVTKAVVKLPVNDQFNQFNPEDLAVTPNGIFLYPEGSEGNLRAFDPSTGKTWITNMASYGFTMLGNTAYFIQPLLDPNSLSFRRSIASAFWNGNDFRDPQVLASDSDATRLFITDNKELFCICGNQVKRINGKLESLAGPSEVHLDLETNEMSFLTTGNELMFYNFLTNRAQLLTRGGLKSQDAFLIRSSIGYGFIGDENGLEAIEIDSRDRQNRYQLLSGKQVWQIALTENQKTILALMDGSIVAVDIRN